jgi:site-specific DNA-methyltransferase (adenine-specific)
MFEKSKIIYGDCIEKMKSIPNKSIDFICCDLPYGTTACVWDIIIPFDKLWEQYKRIIKNKGVIVLFGSEPFSSLLRTSNLNMYKYDWKWVKDNAANFLNKNYQPGKISEDIMIFGNMATSYSKKGNMTYNPQISMGNPYRNKNNVHRGTNAVIRSKINNVITENNGTRLPNNILYFNRDRIKKHQTQKPVALLEYLIKTYTDEGMLVLDNTMGSGSTGVACVNTNRKFIGIEMDEKYFEIACSRIKDSLSQPTLFDNA